MSDPAPDKFEDSLDELERVLRDLEDGATGLDDALARYERGVALLRNCYGQLKDAEQLVRLLAGATADGGPDLRPFEHTSAIETAKAAVRKKPRVTPDDGIPF